MMDVSRKAKIMLAAGSSGSGKSAGVKRAIARVRRVTVWDCEDEYSESDGFVRVTTLGVLIDTLRGRPTARVAYVAPSRRFGDWARCALAWGRCTAVAEEIASVTSPGKAPEGWGDLLRRGRKHGVSVIGVTQRPAESDKTIIGNATTIRCGTLWRARDAEYMADEMNVAVERIRALKPLEWLQVERASGKVTTGTLKFS